MGEGGGERKRGHGRVEGEMREERRRWERRGVGKRR